ncbi:TerC family protein, partial [Salmonella enterica]|uniref:TerC family protein n=1 Tax=Salmonella enterica TaxID=28901 RepID=UPI000646A3F6
LFTVWDFTFSGRDLIMLLGGIFLLFKATTELHERLENREHDTGHGKGYASFWVVVTQIVILDAVFSLDAVITAVGMVKHLPVMMAAGGVGVGGGAPGAKTPGPFFKHQPAGGGVCLWFLVVVGGGGGGGG